MEFAIKNGPEETEFLFSGRMTFADHDKFRSVIAAVAAAAGLRVVFNLDGLDFVDSSGLGLFIIARDTAQKRHLEFSIRGARDEVKRLITLAKFHKLFNITD
jgi:HptB-dependent secretion and biofilm anti anti-sigma factor